jgi:hypothetical protein
LACLIKQSVLASESTGKTPSNSKRCNKNMFYFNYGKYLGEKMGPILELLGAVAHSIDSPHYSYRPSCSVIPRGIRVAHITRGNRPKRICNNVVDKRELIGGVNGCGHRCILAAWQLDLFLCFPHSVNLVFHSFKPTLPF